MADQLTASVSPEAMKLYEADLAAVRRAVARVHQDRLPGQPRGPGRGPCAYGQASQDALFPRLGRALPFKAFRMLPDRLRDRIVRRAIGLP